MSKYKVAFAFEDSLPSVIAPKATRRFIHALEQLSRRDRRLLSVCQIALPTRRFIFHGIMRHGLPTLTLVEKASRAERPTFRSRKMSMYEKSDVLPVTAWTSISWSALLQTVQRAHNRGGVTETGAGWKERGRHVTISVQRTRTSAASGRCHAVHICTMFAHPQRYDYCPVHTGGAAARRVRRSETCIRG